MTPSKDVRSLATLVPVALLMASVAFHGYQIVAHEDDPQRGGAFAMFSTVDIGAIRTVRATAERGSVVLELPPAFQQRATALLDRPSEGSATRLASDLRMLGWSVSAGTATAGGSETFAGIRLQVVGLETEGRTFVRRVLVDVVSGSGA